MSAEQTATQTATQAPTCQGYRCSRPVTTHVEHAQNGWTFDVCNRHAVAYRRMATNGFDYVVTTIGGAK